jgi:hypothetical protein
VIAIVEVPQYRYLGHKREQQSGNKRKDGGDEEISSELIEEYGKIGTHHKLGTMREIQKIHDAKNERQSGCDEKEKYAELKAVQSLNC